MPLAALLSKSEGGVEGMPAYPGVVLTLHVMAKGVEVGAMVGLAIGIVAAVPTFASSSSTSAMTGGKGRRSARVVKQLLSWCEWGVTLGGMGGLVMTLAKAARDETMTTEGIADRAYRLENSKPGIKRDLDVDFLLGGTIGAVGLLLLIPESWGLGDALDRLTGGFSLGGAIGFTVAGGWKVAKKMITKQLVMT